MKEDYEKLIDETFRESRPQIFFDGVWFESFYVAHLIWEMTLALHSTDSEETKSEILQFLKKKSIEMSEIEEKLYKTRHEIVDIFYKHFPKPYEEDWYSFYEELSSFQSELMPSLTQLFLFKSVLLQIDKSHPRRSEIEKALQRSFKKLKDAKEKAKEISPEEIEFFQTIHDAIVITRAIGEDITFEEADKRERKRWE